MIISVLCSYLTPNSCVPIDLDIFHDITRDLEQYDIEANKGNWSLGGQLTMPLTPDTLRLNENHSKNLYFHIFDKPALRMNGGDNAKRRRFDNNSADEDDEKILRVKSMQLKSENSSESGFTLDSGNIYRSVVNMPKILVDRFNEGDIAGLKCLLLSYLDGSCLFKVARPSGEDAIQTYGLPHIYKFYDMSEQAIPDCVFILKKVTKIPFRNGYILRSKLKGSSTLVKDHSVEGLSALVPESVMELVDEKKTSKEDVEAIRMSEEIIREQKKLPHVFVSGYFDCFVNEDTNKIESYVISMRVTSIRAMII